MRAPASLAVEMHASVFESFDTILDARTLEEFIEDHLPGAVSAPVLDGEERARVGTLHKASSFDARRMGGAMVARNVARMLETMFAGRPKTWRPLVYCWRGGKRSGALAHILREVGWDAKTLDGGYRAYRRFVIDEIARLSPKLRFRVVQGATGSGKSRLLRALKSAGAQVLDLEDLASHRGSVLGSLPHRPQPSQKMFESLVARELGKMDASRPVFVEAESRKIGQVQVPGPLIEAMRASACVVLDASLPVRVALLMDEYRHFFAYRPALDAQLDCLVALHGRERIEDWKALAKKARWSTLVERLLAEHYDPAYRRSSARNFTGLEGAESFPLESADDAAFAALARRLAG
jgi:tRNA 2-selenouridine synthase